jgi:hypothetical protein
MAEQWRLSGSYVEFCACDPGCGCNFRGIPTSPEGNCFALLSSRVEDGHYGAIDLAGTKASWALWWPGAIHDKGGRGHAFIDCTSDEQFDALATIYRGEAGYPFFEIFASTLTEPTAVERATVDLVVDGKSSTVRVDSRAEGVMEPLRSPVSGEENDVRIVKDGGFIWKDGAIAQGSLMKVDLPEMSFETTGRHAVFAPFNWGSD